MTAPKMTHGAAFVLALFALAAPGCGVDAVVEGGNDAGVAADAAVAADTADAGAAGTDAAGPEDAAVVPDAAEDATVEPADVAPPVCSEAETKACDDGLACTKDACTMPYAVCKWTLQPGHCLIGGQCRAKGAAKAGDPCRTCAPDLDSKGWSLAADTSPCDDGQACTFNDHCAAGGLCLAEAVACGDGNPCTSDACDPQKGCTYPVLTAVACDDGSKCTGGDVCTVGVCGGKKVACDDGNPCTDDACALASGCTHTDNVLGCSDGDGCTAGDACLGGACKAGVKANCDDGNTCTLDTCQPEAGCYHLPTKSPCCVGETSICDDGNPCTSDDCAAGGGCGHAPNTAPCQDGNACTVADACAGGACKGKVAICNDKNPCTTDACEPKTGCYTAAVSGPCDDGNPCSKGDICGGGVCKGVGVCACTPTFAKQATKLTSLALGKGGAPGEGLDVDGNPKTCAPASNCSAGIDNSLGALAGVANTPLAKAVESGSLVLVFEYKDFKQGPIQLALYQAGLDPSNATCNGQTQTCVWQVAMSMVDPVLSGTSAPCGQPIRGHGRGAEVGRPAESPANAASTGNPHPRRFATPPLPLKRLLQTLDSVTPAEAGAQAKCVNGLGSRLRGNDVWDSKQPFFNSL